MHHRIDRHSPVHHRWDRALEPVRRIRSGDTVDFDLVMAGHGQIERGRPIEETAIDWDTLYHLAGPLWIEDARPGMTLRIDVLELTPGPWGWCYILPELGLLPDLFPDPYLRTFDLDGGPVSIAPGIEAPLAPFLGTMGTHPGEPWEAPVFPPHGGGGNVDCRHLVAGSTLWLPISVAGALFSCGDPHAVQGDGEVCVCALECDMRARLRFSLEDRGTDAPAFRTPPPTATARELVGEGTIGTMGIDPDLYQGARKAVKAMVEWLSVELGLDRRDAYMACSLIGDLRILEVVDAGVWNVGFTVPRACLATGDDREWTGG